MGKQKLLFLSDAVSATSGLGRITRDLALRVHQNLGDLYEVATVGYGGNGTAKLPFQQYHLHDIKNWLVPELPQVWADFVGEEEGILMSVWDLSRLFWLGNPQTCPIPFLRSWVETAKMKKWVYGAIDAGGPNDKLSLKLVDIMKGFDRVLDYSAFSSAITGNPEHLPHGIDTGVWYPRNHEEARAEFVKNGFKGLTADSLLIGIVATNQTRKNWQLAMETCKILLDRGHDVKVWAHTDILERYWSIPTLIADYGLGEKVAVTNGRFTDDQMAWFYAACDMTLGIGPEGFGYPIAESLACGTPVVTGNYAAQTEFVHRKQRVDPIAFHYEGSFCSKRPVFNARDWAITVEKTIGQKVSLPEHLDWNNLWPRWSDWFVRGAAK